jgi:hypothetical protein
MDRDGRGRPYRIAQLGWSRAPAPAHAGERPAEVGRAAISEAGDHGATREQLRISCQHHARHRAAGRQARHEDARAIDIVAVRHVADHLPDRLRLARAARGVAGLEPVEAEVGIVRPLLLGKEQGEAVPVGQPRPARTLVIARRILGAAVQHHHQRSARG